MSILKFDAKACLKCSRCLRYCPSKAIKILSDHESSEIVEKRCIACGNCYKICTHDAIYIRNDIDKIERAISEGKEVVFSVAPSFPAAMEKSQAEVLVAALKELGAVYVEETSLGAEVVFEEYKKYYEEGVKKNLITTSCPSVNYLVETYFPTLIDYLIPVVSPMVAHGKMLKHRYGRDIFVVFAGPCLAKKFEAEEFQHDDIIDVVITFNELVEWLEKEEVFKKNLKPQDFDNKSYKIGSSFPVKGNIVEGLNQNTKSNYQLLQVDGVNECKEVLESLKSNDIDNVFIEINLCKNSCINGPGMPKNNTNYYVRDKRVKEYVKNIPMFSNDIEKLGCELNYSKKYIDRSFEINKASKQELDMILRSMNKYKEEDQLNCAACGYKSCLEKAQSVFEGMSDITTCLPFMQSKAESLQNSIFEYTPNIIFILDKDLKVVEFNPAGERAFNINKKDIINKHIKGLIENNCFEQVLITKENIIGNKVEYKNYGLVVYQNVVYLEDHDVVIVIMIDITSIEKNKEEMLTMKENTLNAAQSVINKQMRVAQEIASLLGETTAETKIILNKLKNLVENESGDIK